jgi:hypothetical protein
MGMHLGPASSVRNVDMFQASYSALEALWGALYLVVGCRLLEKHTSSIVCFTEWEGNGGVFPPWFPGLCILSHVQLCSSVAIHARLEHLPPC